MSCIRDLGNNNLMLTGCVLRYANAIFTPKRVGKPGQERGDPRFSEAFILPDLDPADVEILSHTMQSAVTRLWPAGDAPMTDVAYQQRMSALLGGAWTAGFPEGANVMKTPHPRFLNRVCLSAKAKQDRPPEVYIRNDRASRDRASEIFAGCLVDAVIGIYCYKEGGITASLNGIRLVDNVNVTRLDNAPDVVGAFGIDPTFPAATSPPPDQPAPAVPAHQQVAPGQAPGAMSPGPVTIPASDVPEYLR